MSIYPSTYLHVFSSTPVEAPVTSGESYLHPHRHVHHVKCRVGKRGCMADVSWLLSLSCRGPTLMGKPLSSGLGGVHDPLLACPS
jgi:hypothetical protein